MDFRLPDEHRMLRDTVRDFCEEEIAPITREIESERRYPADVFEQLAALEVMGVPVGEAYGGLGGDQLMYALVAEELGRVSGSIGLSYVVHVSLASTPIELFGTAEQKERWLRPLAEGEYVGGRALTETEPERGSDASDGDRIIAEREGDEYVLTGTKRFVTNASVAGSILVTAVTDPGAGSDGISTFIVDPREDDGLEVTGRNGMGPNASPTCEIRLDDVRLPADRLLGAEGDGREQTKRTLEGGRIALAALSVGLARGAFEVAREYGRGRGRERFGTEGGESGAVDTVVSMHRKIERARLLTYRAATEYDRGERVAREGALAKLDASEAAREVAADAVRVSGWDGYREDSPPQRFYRDAKLMEIVAGTSRIQRLVIGRELGL